MKNKKEKIQNIEEHLVDALHKRESCTPEGLQEEVWQRVLLAQKRGGLPPKKTRKLIQWQRVAVAACVILAIGWAFYLLRNKPIDQLLDAVAQMQTSAADTTDYVLLVTASGEKVALSKDSKVISQSGDGKIKVDNKAVNLNSEASLNETIAFNQVLVPLGKHIRLVLSDGSLLDINSGTKVIYPQVFRKEKREIYVEGEIFIDVKKENGKPFVVKTSQFEVNVLGTAFNVRAYPKDRAAEVVLQRGKVIVEDAEKHVVEMLPNNLVALNQGCYVSKKVVDVSKYIAWKEGLLIFEGETLAEVTDRLKNFYGIDFYCSPDVKRLTLFGKLDMNESIDKVLSAIAETTGVSYELKQGRCFLKSRE